MICAAVDQNGFIYATAEVYPNCSDFVLVTAGYADRLTYWADLAIELDPSGTVFYPLLAAIVTSVGVVLGARMVFDNLRTITEEA